MVRGLSIVTDVLKMVTIRARTPGYGESSFFARVHTHPHQPVWCSQRQKFAAKGPQQCPVRFCTQTPSCDPRSKN